MKEDKISDEISYSIHVGMCVELQHIVTWGGILPTCCKLQILAIVQCLVKKIDALSLSDLTE